MTTSPSGPLKPTHYLILVALAEEPTYGVALMERIEERSKGAVRMNAGSLYRTLAALVEDGWVEPIREEQPASGAGAPRKLYGLTALGRTALRGEVARQQDLLEAVKALDLLEESL